MSAKKARHPKEKPRPVRDTLGGAEVNFGCTLNAKRLAISHDRFLFQSMANCGLQKYSTLTWIKRSTWLQRSFIDGSRSGVPHQQCQSGSLPSVPGKVGRSTRECTQNGVGNGAVSVSGGMAARYRSGYLVSGGVERSSTQKPWRPESPSPGIHSASQTYVT